MSKYSADLKELLIRGIRAILMRPMMMYWKVVQDC